MTGPPTNIVQILFTFIFGDASSLRSVLIRGLSVLIALLSYFALIHQDDIATYLREAPVKQYTETLAQKRATQYPILAKERAIMLQNTINPSTVIVIGYSPQFTNEVTSVIAQTGVPTVNWGSVAIDKASEMYRANSLGEGFSHKLELESYLYDKDFIVPYQLLSDFKYIFAYPIFDLDNSYSGAILICWIDIPKDALKNEQVFSRRMRLIVLPSARALGRAK